MLASSAVGSAGVGHGTVVREHEDKSLFLILSKPVSRGSFVAGKFLLGIYFARSAEAAREVFTSSEDPGRLGRSAYTYFHLPMVAGIIRPV